MLSSEGAVLLGEEGVVSHLSCSGDAVYDWSTGLIFKNGNYYDPTQGIWISLGTVGIIIGLHQPQNRRERRRGKKLSNISYANYFWLVLLMLFTMLLASCVSEPVPTPTPITCEKTTLPNTIDPSNAPKQFDQQIKDSTVFLSFTKVDSVGTLRIDTQSLGTVVHDEQGTQGIISHNHFKNLQNATHLTVENDSRSLLVDLEINKDVFILPLNSRPQVLYLYMPIALDETKVEAVARKDNANLDENDWVSVIYSPLPPGELNTPNEEIDVMHTVVKSKGEQEGQPYIEGYNLCGAITKGDSGGGAFVKGEHVGNTWDVGSDSVSYISPNGTVNCSENHAFRSALN